MGRESEQQRIPVDNLAAMANMLRESLASLDRVVEVSRRNDLSELSVRQVPTGKKALENLLAFTALLNSSLADQILPTPKKQSKRDTVKALVTDLEQKLDTKRNTKSD